MSSSGATNHRIEVSKYSVCCKEGTVHPSTPLLDQDGQIFWSIGEGLCVWDVGQVVPGFLFNVNLKAHYSVFSEILVGFWTGGVGIAVDQLEELVHWTTLNRLPSEEGVGTRKHRVVTEEAFTSFIWGVSEFVLVELGGFHQIRNIEIGVS